MTTQRSREDPAVEVTSEPLVFPGRSGLKIAAYWDHRPEGFKGCPFVVMAPKFGETKKNNLQLAYYLAANGLNVVRFDHTCHVGESAGDPLQFTFPSAVEDIQATFDYLETEFGVTAAGLVGNSLSARPALRAAAVDKRVAFLVCAVGVVNFRDSMLQVYREDVLGQYLDGRKWGINDVLGYAIDFDHFLEAAVGANLHDLAGTVADARRIRVPLVFFPAEHDTWVNAREVAEVAAACPQAVVHAVAGAMHEVRENPEAAERFFRDIVNACVQHAYGAAVPPAAALVPRKSALLRQNRIERERLRRTELAGGDRNTFWSDYLKKFDYIKEGRAYRGYLDLLLELIAPLRSGEVALDAGCGNGTVGVWAQRHLAAGAPEAERAMWLSVDLTDAGLRVAANQHLAMPPEVAAGAALDFGYLQTDFDQPPLATSLAWLADASVDVVVASLLVSYLADPDRALAEFHRVLRPRGRIVVSSMKPHCDMSGIYRDFMDEGAAGVRLEPARDLLRAAGAIRLKEEVGVFRFCSAEELCAMLTRAGFRRCASFVAFGNQAIVVRAEK